MSRAEIVVDLAAIRHNVRRLREITGTPVMTVVKADGYGHGLLEVARAARRAGAAWLGVASLGEAVALREGGDAGPVLSWLVTPGEDWAPAIRAGVDVTAYSIADLDAIEATGLPARVQLKVDTGLGRGGATLADWPALVARARSGEAAGRWRITGIWSHLSAGEVPDDPFNDEQEKVFGEALDIAYDAGLRPDLRHLANSAAALLRPSSRFDLVRCGIATYGLDPAPGETPTGLGLIPAMTVRATLAMVKDVEPGAGVSYNHTWTAERPTTLGLVPAGYADGIPRSAGNRAEVSIRPSAYSTTDGNRAEVSIRPSAYSTTDGNPRSAGDRAEVSIRPSAYSTTDGTSTTDGVRAPIRGRICMDQFVVEVPPGTRAGDEVLIWGPGTHGEPSAQDWAVASGTISYEMVTRIGGRFVRRYVDSGLDRAETEGKGEQ